MNEGASEKRVISHYRILRKIGAGGMGEVYLAEDTRLDRKVALKLLPAAYTEHKERLKRLEQEARTASALNHPNIVTVHEFASEGESHFIVTEFVDGVSLREKLVAEKLSALEALEIAAQTASALAAAHDAGIIHRDIKPDNIMLRRDGFVKVLDFGLAKLAEIPEEVVEFDGSQESDLEAPTRTHVITGLGKVMGTVSYMSPEQARGISVDLRTDIFSLGVVVYEMLAGRKPFTGTTPTDIIISVVEKEPLPLTNFAVEVPSELAFVVTKALCKDRDERYQSAKEFLADLRRIKQRLEFDTELARSQSASGAEAIVSGAVKTSSQPIHTTSSAEYLVTQITTHKSGFALAAIIILALIGASYWFLFHRALSAPAINSIAVLPFQNKSADADTEYLSDGLTESLIYQLSQLPNLKVSPTSSVFRYRGEQPDAVKIGNEIGVHAVMSGRLVQRGEHLTISVELVDVRNNNLLWGEQYERRTSELLATQREIAIEITQKLRLKLSGDSAKGLNKRYTENNQAYQLYLKGRYYWNKRNENDFKKGIEYFRQAVEVDPNFALAWSGLADSYALLPLFSEMPASEVKGKIKAAAAKALELDPELAEAHCSQAVFLVLHELEFVEAEREFRRAIELNPTYATAHHWLSITLSWRLRHEEALKEMRQALEIEPLSRIINNDLGNAFLYQGQYDRAIQQFRKTLELHPDFVHGHHSLALALATAGKYDEAIAEQNKAIALAGPLPGFVVQLGYIYAVSGNKVEAEKILNELLERRKTELVGNFNLAIVYAGLGEKDKAFELLVKPEQDRFGPILSLKASPYFEKLRGDERYRQMLNRLNLE